uniref:ISXO2-like transposase domain-containing protein n=1 Tax=Plectus sambesii TaxID=2011161 RepID=A0A914VHY5_9BILA
MKTLRAGTCAIDPHHQSGPGQIGGRGTWFALIDKLGRNSSQLPIHVILMLLWGWARLFSFDQMRSIFGRFIRTANNHLLTDWFYYICEMIANYLENGAAPMGGSGSEVQINESFFGGKQKYNRGRLVVKDWFERRRPRLNASQVRKASKRVSPNKRNNFARKIVNRWGWVFGLVWVQPDDICQRQFFRVAKRDRDTLHLIIKKHVASGTAIISDLWKTYHGLVAC